MIIKKTYQGTVPENKILNTYSNSQTDVYSCNYVNGKILYSGDGVATGTITLEDDLSNYEYIDIFYTNGELDYNIKVYEPNGKKVGLFSASPEASLLQVDNNHINLSGKSITFGTGRRTNLISNNFATWSADNQVIYRVVGYTKTTD